MDNSVIAKSGWLLRKASDINWEKNWVELYRDGYLKYYESDYSPNAEDVIFMPTECLTIKTGLQVDLATRLPNGHNRQCLFLISAMGNKIWIFCGETLDDMRAWQLALEQARLLVIQSNYSNNPMVNQRNIPIEINSSPQYWPCNHTPLSIPNPYGPFFGDGSLNYFPNRLPPYANYQLHNNYYIDNQNLLNYNYAYPTNQLPVRHSQPIQYGYDNSLINEPIGSMIWRQYIWWQSSL